MTFLNMSLKILGSEIHPGPSFAEGKELIQGFPTKNMYSILVVTVTGRSYSKSQVISSLHYFYCYIYHFHLQLRCFSTINFRFPEALIQRFFLLRQKRLQRQLYLKMWGAKCTDSLLVSGSEISHPTLLHHELPPFEKNELLRFWFRESVKKKIISSPTWDLGEKKKETTNQREATNQQNGSKKCCFAKNGCFILSKFLRYIEEKWHYLWINFCWLVVSPPI